MDGWEELYLYWARKRVDGRPPARADIDPPTEIPQFVSELMIIDVLPDGYRYRLVGGAIRDRIGGELTGKAVGSSKQSESVRQAWKTLLDAVRDDQKPRMLVASVQLGASLSNLMVVLPLIDRRGKIECLLAGAFFSRPNVRPNELTDQVIIREIREEGSGLTLD